MMDLHFTFGFHVRSIWCTWGSYGKTLLSKMPRCVHSQVFAASPHRRGLLWHGLPAHVVYGTPRVSP